MSAMEKMALDILMKVIPPHEMDKVVSFIVNAIDDSNLVKQSIIEIKAEQAAQRQILEGIANALNVQQTELLAIGTDYRSDDNNAPIQHFGT
jgi:hypothetical protein